MLQNWMKRKNCRTIFIPAKRQKEPIVLVCGMGGGWGKGGASVKRGSALFNKKILGGGKNGLEYQMSLK